MRSENGSNNDDIPMIPLAALKLLRCLDQYVIGYVHNTGEKYEMYVARNGDILCRVRMKYFTS